jgi:hypothetical protein
MSYLEEAKTGMESADWEWWRARVAEKKEK